MISPIETQLKKHVADFLARHLADQKPIALALSGGIDSIVLLDILYRLDLANPTPGVVFSMEASAQIEAIHVNHHISLNANKWTDFCVAECTKRNVKITVENINVDRNSGTGLEAAAREARYKALMKTNAHFILTAQHLDDQAETVLHQMLRGTGLNGLAGMGEARALDDTKILLRPLLMITREQIEAYAKSRLLKWIEDESNTDITYTRNYLRHELVPGIKKRFPQYAESLARTARHAAEAAKLSEALAMIDLKWNADAASPNAFADALDTLPLTRQTNALYHWLKWQKVMPPSHAQLEEWAVQIFREAPESKPHQAGGHEFVILRKKGRLELQR